MSYDPVNCKKCGHPNDPFHDKLCKNCCDPLTPQAEKELAELLNKQMIDKTVKSIIINGQLAKRKKKEKKEPKRLLQRVFKKKDTKILKEPQTPEKPTLPLPKPPTLAKETAKKQFKTISEQTKKNRAKRNRRKRRI